MERTLRACGDMMPKSLHIAVLGAGIMGCATALFLARGGARVSLFDAADRPFDGASRWNEGKIHLGFLYAADESGETITRLLPGGLAFKDLTEQLIGCRLDGVTTQHDDTFLVHRDSVVSPERMGQHCRTVAMLASTHPDSGRYLCRLADAAPVSFSKAELERDYDTSVITAGFRVPERAVSTRWIADRFVEAVEAEDRIERVMATGVDRVAPVHDTLNGPLNVVTVRGTEGPFDHVVNALWHGRLAVDQGIGCPMPSEWSHRYRLSIFARLRTPIAITSAVVATGPFGDIKTYNDRDLYLSWYSAGLIAEGTGIAPPAVTIDRLAGERAIDTTLMELGRIFPALGTLRAQAEELVLGGGWVFAAGTGSLADRRSTLHRRDRIGIATAGSYTSVDTGKYSIAPWLALQIADAILGR